MIKMFYQKKKEALATQNAVQEPAARASWDTVLDAEPWASPSPDRVCPC